MYFKNSKGVWILHRRPEMCAKSLISAGIVDGHCRGVKGHEGDCWSYSGDGWYRVSYLDGGFSATPPGHPKWVSPVDMISKTCAAHVVESVVVDPELIAMLERDDIPDGESLVRSIIVAEEDKLRDLGRL